MSVFNEYFSAAQHVMDHCQVPKVVFKGCAGIIFIKAEQVAFGVSGGVGRGLLFRKTEDGKWTQPVALTLFKMGAGISIGAANRDTVIVLNHFAMKKFMEGEVKLDISVDLGGAAGPVGASAAGAIAASEKGGVATGFAYTHQEGAMINLEAGMGGLYGANVANEEMYGTVSLADILEGKATPKQADAVELAGLLKKVEEFTSS